MNNREMSHRSQATLISCNSGTTSKLNPWLTVGSVRLRPVFIILNNGNRPEPDGTSGQPALGFEVAPVALFLYNNFIKSSW